MPQLRLKPTLACLHRPHELSRAVSSASGLESKAQTNLKAESRFCFCRQGGLWRPRRPSDPLCAARSKPASWGEGACARAACGCVRECACARVSINLLQPSILHKPSLSHRGSQKAGVIVPMLKPRKLRCREEWTRQRPQTSKQVSAQACLAPRCPLEPKLFQYQPQTCQPSCPPENIPRPFSTTLLDCSLCPLGHD